jgi:hypothetical protein
VPVWGGGNAAAGGSEVYLVARNLHDRAASMIWEVQAAAKSGIICKRDKSRYQAYDHALTGAFARGAIEEVLR